MADRLTEEQIDAIRERCESELYDRPSRFRSVFDDRAALLVEVEHLLAIVDKLQPRTKDDRPISLKSIVYVNDIDDEAGRFNHCGPCQGRYPNTIASRRGAIEGARIMADLKPCVACHCDDIRYFDNSDRLTPGHRIFCPGCMAELDCASYEEAVATWNARWEVLARLKGIDEAAEGVREFFDEDDHCYVLDVEAGLNCCKECLRLEGDGHMDDCRIGALLTALKPVKEMGGAKTGGILPVDPVTDSDINT